MTFTPAPGRRFVVPAAVLIFVVAAALRLGFVWESLAEPSLRTPTPGLDAQLGWTAAGALKDGVPIRPNLELMMASAPAFLYWLAAIRLAVGDDMTAARAVLAGLGAARLMLVFLVGLYLTGRVWAATSGALLLAFLPSLIYYDGTLYKAGTDVSLLALLLFAMVAPRGTGSPSWSRGLVVAGLLALCFLSQLITVTYVAAIGAYAAAAGWPRASRWRFLAVVVGVFGVVVAGFFVRPWLAGQETLHYLPRMGVDLRIAFHEGATGYYTQLPGVPPRPAGHAFESRLVAELETGRRMTWSEANAHHTRAALRFVRENPGRALALVRAKTQYFLNDFELKGEDYLPYVGRYSRVLRWSPVSFGWLFVLGMVGVLALVRQGQFHVVALIGGLFVCVLAANVLGFVTSRFRLPAVIPLAVLAGPGLVAVADLARDVARRGPSPAAMLPASVALVAAWLAFRPLLVHTDADFLLSAEANRRLSISAEHAATRLAEADPRDERLRFPLLEQLGRRTEAFATLRRLAPQHSADTLVNRAYLRYLLWLSRYDEAANHLERVCREAGGEAYDAAIRGQDNVAGVLGQFVLTTLPDCADGGQPSTLETASAPARRRPPTP